MTRLLPKVMLMNQIKIKDNSSNKKDAFKKIEKLTDSISNKTLEQLERDGVFVFPELVANAEDITKDQMILQSVNDTYRSGNVMGFLGYGNEERLIIQSRFSRGSEDYFFIQSIHAFYGFLFNIAFP